MEVLHEKIIELDQTLNVVKLSVLCLAAAMNRPTVRNAPNTASLWVYLRIWLSGPDGASVLHSVVFRFGFCPLRAQLVVLLTPLNLGFCTVVCKGGRIWGRKYNGIK